MNKLKNIFRLERLLKAIALAIFIHVFSVSNAFAWDASSYCGELTYRKDTKINESFDNDEVKQKIKEKQAFENKYKDFCKKVQNFLDQSKKEKKELGGTKDFDDKVFRQYNLLNSEDYKAYTERFNKILEYNPDLKNEYEALLAEDKVVSKELSNVRDKQLKEHDEAKKSGAYIPCGDKYPRGCPEGKKCFNKRTGHSIDETSVGSVAFESFDCLDPNDMNLLWTEAPKGSEGSGNSFKTNVAGAYTKLTTDETGQTHVETNMEKKKRDNSACQIKRMQELYQSKCYACVIVKTLLETFLVACSQVYDLTSEAGSKILVIGALIWLAFFALKNVSSFANVEPGAMVNTLFVFLFKVMVAYIVINSGLTTIIHYTINPLVTAGADYGLGLMSTMENVSGATSYKVVVPTITSIDGETTADIISADVINKIMLFTQNLDKTVSTNLVIGHALTCHSMNAGAWDLGLLYMVNIWIWLCGAAIWFCGFMLTLGICYYLLDISFKLGFAIIALPVVIGLWPFNITKNKLAQTISIILSSAATFAFLALTTTYALALISASLRDLPTLYNAINTGKADWISETFDISGPYFLIIMFAYLYSIKLIGSTISDYVDKFFSDGVFGSQSPMHHKLTQVTDFAKQKVTGAASAAGGAIAGQAGKGAEKVLGKAVGFVKNKFKPKDNAKDKNKDKGGNPVSSAGKATKNAGKTAEQTGKATEKVGKTAEKGGKGLSKGGDGMMKAGKALSGTGLGAIIGVPMIIAGGAVKGAGAVTQYAGKATKKAGQAMKKSGKTMKKIGERMEKAGDKMEKTGNNLKYGKDSADNNPPSDDK